MGELWLVDSMHRAAMPLHYASHGPQCLKKYGKETNLKGTGSPASLLCCSLVTCIVEKCRDTACPSGGRPVARTCVQRASSGHLSSMLLFTYLSIQCTSQPLHVSWDKIVRKVGKISVEKTRTVSWGQMEVTCVLGMQPGMIS